MFDDTSFDRLYGDAALTRNAMITALACKALTIICDDSEEAGERRRHSRCATRKGAHMTQPS